MPTATMSWPTRPPSRSSPRTTPAPRSRSKPPTLPSLEGTTSIAPPRLGPKRTRPRTGPPPLPPLPTPRHFSSSLSGTRTPRRLWRSTLPPLAGTTSTGLLPPRKTRAKRTSALPFWPRRLGSRSSPGTTPTPRKVSRAPTPPYSVATTSLVRALRSRRTRRMPRNVPLFLPKPQGSASWRRTMHIPRSASPAPTPPPSVATTSLVRALRSRRTRRMPRNAPLFLPKLPASRSWPRTMRIPRSESPALIPPPSA
mmetsp:Transcript_30929/g.92703  ORF Transcript_30929/g.92703 Transcript_30929/m.92703 type:complete len:254 (+) Transcript_30929:1640-2401(+)